ncbi:MAG: thymidylate synthase [Vitreoscilla sp.]
MDDLLFKVYGLILRRGKHIEPSKGPASEITGALLKLSAPRVRLSRTESRGNLFSCIGELLWILAGTNRLDFIQYYLKDYDQFSDDKKTIFGAYGPRIFGQSPDNQVARVIELLRAKPDSRQAVIQLFDRTDTIEVHKDVPCTCTLQLLLRDRRLHMIASMRSNDAWLGLPHDVFTFTMLQELMARSLGVELGEYKHSVGSLHIYDEHAEKATTFLDEGWQPHRTMSPMPKGDPWEAVKRLVALERRVRQGKADDEDPRQSMDPYWADLVTLLMIYKASRPPNNRNEVARLRRRLSDDVYTMYINKRNKLMPSTDNDQRLLFDGKSPQNKETT